MRKEYRAVFSSPSGGIGSYGPEQTSLKLAMSDTPENTMEEYLSGVEVREVQPWEAVPLKDILAVAP